MNTTMYNPATDERFEGEDAADALFASMLLEPPKWLDERILSLAREEAEFSRLEQLSDAMFAQIMVEPPAHLDQRIMAKAKAVFEPTLVEVVINGIKMLADAIISSYGETLDLRHTYHFHALAAAGENTGAGDRILRNEPDNYGLSGDCSLHVVHNYHDPSIRSLRLIVHGERKTAYEGRKVEVRNKDGETVLSGTIQSGQIKTIMKKDMIFEPPFSLTVGLLENNS